MRKICIINQKGGVAKTTTAVNLAAGLSREDKKVLVVDLDPQGNVSSCLGQTDGKDMHDLLSENAEPGECIRHLAKNFDILPSNEKLLETERAMIREGKRSLLKEKLDKVDGYDYIIVDCPPSLGMLSNNALIYADEAIIPSTTDILSIEALRKTVLVIQALNESGNEIIISKIVPTMFDKRNKICVECLKQIQAEFYEIVSEPIRVNSKLRECPKSNKSIFAYDKSSRGAEDYGKLVRSVVHDEAKVSKMSAMIKVKVKE